MVFVEGDEVLDRLGDNFFRGSNAAPRAVAKS
jgi:hypothetical protein